MLGGGVDLPELPLDATVPDALLPDVASVNGRRGRAEIFSRYARQGYTLREPAVEERFRAGVLDVISLQGLADPRQHEFVIDGLLAELRRRGIVDTDYGGTTLRENLGLVLPERAPLVARPCEQRSGATV